MGERPAPTRTRTEHRSVAGIVARDGKFFVARRVPGGAMGDRWEFPGGKVEEGEDDREALMREYDEEFAVPVSVGRLLASARFEHKGRKRALRAYSVAFEREDFVLSEHTEWRWASLDEIEALDFADSDRKLLEQLRTELAPD